MSNWKQFCRVDGTDSKVADITIGVPKGSCLEPLLFLIYISYFPIPITNSNAAMYTDDTSICYQSHEITQLNEAIINDLYKLVKWLEGNKLSLNVAKSRAMLISTNQKYKAFQDRSQDLCVKIKGTELHIVLNTKYLGVNIDSSLDWKDRIMVMSSTVSRAIGFLKHARNFPPQNVLKTLYTGILESYFVTAAPFGAVAGKQNSPNYESCKT